MPDRPFALAAIVLLLWWAGTQAAVAGAIEVEYHNGRLMLRAEKRPFGEVMDSVARKVGFAVKIPAELRLKAISIRLVNAPLDRAIGRLFDLVQERNYTVRYLPSGKIGRVEVVRAGRDAAGEQRDGGKVKRSGKKTGHERIPHPRYVPPVKRRTVPPPVMPPH